ncbi:reticulon-like protein B21 [Senna tora]|uniref:Reticulon-like protein B21 n=1 Tax=Senna tora TaxID=362788 RepID=A0A834T148_9FABA|nr:reticulon-like protein B21 [Senna tora]
MNSETKIPSLQLVSLFLLRRSFLVDDQWVTGKGKGEESGFGLTEVQIDMKSSICDEMRFRRSSNGKRKTWKSESSEGFDKSQILGVKKNCDVDDDEQQQCKGLSVVSYSDEIKKNPIHARKIRAKTQKARFEGKTESDSIGTANPNVESLIQLKINNTDGICKDFCVCQ